MTHLTFEAEYRKETLRPLTVGVHTYGGSSVVFFDSSHGTCNFHMTIGDLGRLRAIIDTAIDSLTAELAQAEEKAG